MSKTIRNIHGHLKKKYCKFGNCRASDIKVQKQKQNMKNKQIIDKHLADTSALHTPSTFYTSGIYGTQNCNTSITSNGMSQTDMALSAVDNVLSRGEEPTSISPFKKLSVYCRQQNNMETFDSRVIVDNGGCSKRKSGRRIVLYSILLILIIICLVGWIYFGVLSSR